MARTLTYGDTFSIARTPGVVWRVADLRRLDSASGRTRDARARLYPVSVDGVDANYTTELRIGRSTRSGLLIELSVGTHTPEGFDPDKLHIWPTAKEGLTDLQRQGLIDELSAFTFSLPLLTDVEIREAMLRTASQLGHNAARDNWREMPARFDGRNASDPATDRGRIVAAMADDPEAWPAFIQTATEAFTERLTADLRTY